MSRWFWGFYWPMSVLVVAAMAAWPFAPQAEGLFWPVRTDQRIAGVERTAGELCWVWESFKARDKVSDNLDLFIDTPGQLGAVGAPYERGTGMPWVRSRAVAAHQWHWQPYCVALPPYVTPADTVRVRQTAYYPGLFGLWRVALQLPDVVSAGTAPR